MQKSFKESRAALSNSTDHVLKEIKEKGKSVYDKSKPYVKKFVLYVFQGLVAYGVKELLDLCLDESSNSHLSEVIDPETFDSEPAFFQTLDEPKRSYTPHVPEWEVRPGFMRLPNGRKASQKAIDLSIQNEGTPPPPNMTYRKGHKSRHQELCS